MDSKEYLQLRELMQQNQRHLLMNQQQLQRLVQHANRDRWYISFGSDVAANLVTDGLIWIARRLFRKL